MDLALIAVGAVGLVAGWGSRGESKSMNPVSALLLVGGAVALIAGAVVFGIAFAEGFQQGYQSTR